jgi:hypothetical protein
MNDLRKGFHELESKRLVNCPYRKKGSKCYFFYPLYCGSIRCHLYVCSVQRYDSKGNYRNDSKVMKDEMAST